MHKSNVALLYGIGESAGTQSLMEVLRTAMGRIDAVLLYGSYFCECGLSCTHSRATRAQDLGAALSLVGRVCTARHC